MKRLPICLALALCSMTALSTSARAEGCRSALVTVSVDWQKEHAPTAAGVVARITYPAQVDVPTDPKDHSARSRVDNLTGAAGGLFDAIPKRNAESEGGILSVGLVARDIPPGDFARVRFDCTSGSRPDAQAFSCVAEVSDLSGLVETPRCSARVLLE